MQRSRFDIELERILDELEELEADASDCGEIAVCDKINEARGPLTSARTAAVQYQDGTLERP